MPLSLYRRGTIWHYRGTVGPAGRRKKLRGSCHTADQDNAARQIAEIEKRYWDGHFEGPAAILTFEQACLLLPRLFRPRMEAFRKRLTAPTSGIMTGYGSIDQARGCGELRQFRSPLLGWDAESSRRLRLEHIGSDGLCCPRTVALSAAYEENFCLPWVAEFIRRSPLIRFCAPEG